MYSPDLISDANKRFSSQYRGELANHLPMDLVALERLGATPERLCSFRDHYITRLEPKQSTQSIEISAENWKTHLGQNTYHANYLEYFKSALEVNGLEETLVTHLPKLFQGVAGGAFHGLIRLGYALDTNNLEEVYQSLGYWAVSYLDLGAREFATGAKTPAEIFSGLNAKFYGVQTKASNIGRRMEVIGKLKHFREICEEVDTASITYSTLAPLVLALFAQTQDFTALHAVTATHAFRWVSKYCSASHDLFVGLAAAYVSIRAPKVMEIEPTQKQVSWEPLKEKAIASNDDHVPKIVYTCFEEYRVHRDPTYFVAASKYAENPR
jgi:hypothetical protein